jgi:hypothetical protein
MIPASPESRSAPADVLEATVMNAARMLGVWPLALALLVFGAGCRRPATLHPVNGKVSYKGAVLTNGVVVFTPDASRGESGPIALGAIRADGNYTLTTGEASGVSAGWYRVTVAAFTAPAAANPQADRFQTPVSVLPEKYRDPELSLLRCEIKSDHVNTIDLNLD